MRGQDNEDLMRRLFGMFSGGMMGTYKRPQKKTTTTGSTGGTGNDGGDDGTGNGDNGRGGNDRILT